MLPLLHAFSEYTLISEETIMMRSAVLLPALILLPALDPRVRQEPGSPVPLEELRTYLTDHWQGPEKYIVSKFESYDIIFLGEYYCIKHDVELVHALIPRMYEAGVRNLGIEFGNYELQNQVDALTTAEQYDEGLARRLMFAWNPTWGYREYQDIYRAAWKLNHSLPEDAPRFRVVNLSSGSPWDPAGLGLTLEEAKWLGHQDGHMAEVILREFVDAGEKALVYSQVRHAHTRYHEPWWFPISESHLGMGICAGNLVYRKIPERTFTIFLHSPWMGARAYAPICPPVDGAIDLVMDAFEDKRVGFDVTRTPFGALRDDDVHEAIGYENFTLGAYCDGYVYQMTFDKYRSCTVDPEFITPENLKDALPRVNVAGQPSVFSCEELLDRIREYADIEREFKRLRLGQ